MKPLPVIAFLMLALAADARAEPAQSSDFAGELLTIAQGNDAGFGTAIAPALSTESRKTRPERAAEVVAAMAHELESVLRAFTAADPGQKVAATRSAVAAFDPQAARAGASRTFEGDGPALSAMRQLLFVRTAGPDDAATERVMGIVSSFERSPKPEDTYYAYSRPLDLKQSSISELPGSAASWTKGAQYPMEPGKLYGLKKCRDVPILGWYCNTSRYQVRPFGASSRLLAVFLAPLPPGADNPAFDDDRAENVAEGYTGVYVVTSASGLTLVYNLGFQSSAAPPRLQSILAEEHDDEYRQLAERIRSDLGSAALP